MEAFTTVTSIAAPMPVRDISTDLIAPTMIPGRTPLEVSKLPIGARLFANLRYLPGGEPDPAFVLNQPRYAVAQILLAGPNFGCGSSRETAVWALMEFGIRCIIAPGFAEIFRENALQNGLLPAELPMAQVQALTKAADTQPVTIDLHACTVRCPGVADAAFTLSDDRRLPLLEGLDQLGFMLRSATDIAAFEATDHARRPWIYASPATGPMDARHPAINALRKE